MIIYGKHKETKEPIYIEDALRGKKCNCVCFECDGDLVAKKGPKINHFFGHLIPMDCKGAPETAIHKLSKAIIAQHSRILSPKGWINYSEVEIEKDLGFLCPDIEISTDEGKIYIEVFVRNKKKEKQISIYKANKLTSFEIDISKISYDISPDELETIVLSEMSNRYSLYGFEEIEPVINEPEPNVQAIAHAKDKRKGESIWIRIESFIKENIVPIIFVLSIMIVGFAFANRQTNRRYRR